VTFRHRMLACFDPAPAWYVYVFVRACWTFSTTRHNEARCLCWNVCAGGRRCSTEGFPPAAQFLFGHRLPVAEQCLCSGELLLLPLLHHLDAAANSVTTQILTNLALVTACTFIYALQRLFYGPLRPIEIEHLSEKAWYAVLDTLLAMPSLRDEVGGWMLAVFVLLLAGKVWSWIGEGRVDILEQQPPQNPRLFHTRLASSLLVSTAFSAAMLRYCIATVKDDPRPGMMVIFTFEFAILLIFSLFTLLRYVLALTEARVLKQQTKAKMDERRAEIRAERERLEQEREGSTDPDSLPALPSEEDVDENEIDVPGWEEKRRWLFGLELATGSSFMSQSALSELTHLRFHQTHCLHRLLWHLSDLYGTAHAHHSRRLSYLCLFRQACTGLQQLPQGHSEHEQPISRCHQRRVDK